MQLKYLSYTSSMYYVYLCHCALQFYYNVCVLFHCALGTDVL